MPICPARGFVTRPRFAGKLAEVVPGQPILTRPGQAVQVLEEARGW